ncbi:hypothetical protein GCM10011344_41300 [Dokdonia pacifica]|uniref:Uncharacterized protein n=1 Tax=Dokdonia pacifica TaxID=1627892 RepID=A0A239AC73_9FLAO|nr:hypothetical protein [Dokdonia pacifica]GGG36163.1 hypothetical protein GCM10011344_41300 [Dokdonia pacifica]SNR93149.1 hypothetical protein SAMN06265376_104316 [Dokdonia pacifica]
MSENKKRNGGLLNALIDKDGIKTEVTLTITNTTATKVALTLLISGISLIVMARLLKEVFPSKELTAIKSDVSEIKSILNK